MLRPESRWLDEMTCGNDSCSVEQHDVQLREAERECLERIEAYSLPPDQGQCQLSHYFTFSAYVIVIAVSSNILILKIISTSVFI